MTNRTRALGHRLLGSLKNECIVIVTHESLHTVTIVNGTTGKAFYTAHESEDFVSLVHAIKAAPGYPTPKVRQPKGFARRYSVVRMVG